MYWLWEEIECLVFDGFWAGQEVCGPGWEAYWE